MKIVNLRKKIGASLLVAGMITPGAAHAAGVNINLLADPSFENVDAEPLGNYQTQPLNSWSNGTQVGATYRYEQDFDKPNNTSAGTGVNDPNLNPPNPGLRYFTANYPNHDNGPANNHDGGHNLGLDTTDPSEVMQVVDVSTGPTADEIAKGQAEYWLSGWFGGYNGNASDAVLALNFLNANNVSLGTASVSGLGFEWNEQSTSGIIPTGTTSVKASVYGDDSGTGAALVDLANFTIHGIPEPSTALLVGIGFLGVGAFSRKRKA